MAGESKIVPANLPNNSNRAKETKPKEVKSEQPPKVVNKVVTGTVTIKKSSILDRVSHFIFGDDIKVVIADSIKNVLIPAAKGVLFDMLVGGIETRFGRTRGRDRGERRYVSYDGYYRDSHNREEVRVSVGPNLERFLFGRREDADDVLMRLSELINMYDIATVSDFYQAIGQPVDYTWQKYGWKGLGGAYVRPVGGGYIIIMPSPIVIDEM